MLENFRIFSNRTKNRGLNNSVADTRPVMETLLNNLNRELDLRLHGLSKTTDAAPVTAALHQTIDNLTDCRVAVEQTLLQSSLKPDKTLVTLANLINQTNQICEAVADSSQADEISNRTLNLLFCAAQEIKRQFSVANSLGTANQSATAFSEDNAKQLSPAGSELKVGIPRMVIPSPIIYQLHHALFPPEKMLVGAGRRDGTDVFIEAVFEVTGEANSGHVRANPDSLGRALIAMEETGTYLALWVHSHPGRGEGMTHPSNTDVKQHADWLKHYSADLVSAIMVEDRFVRFWGMAIENGTVSVTVNGAGVKQEDENEYLYRIG